jgi:drug/metabolite transporter (DMT)-like permease
LVAVTVIWGSTFVIVHSSLHSLSALVLVASRFAVAALALALLQPSKLRQAASIVLPALPLTVAMFAGMALQTFGLQTTTPARSGFLTALSVLMVPGLVAARTGRLPRRRLLMAVGMATLGVYILFRPIGLEWHRGDTLTVLSALAFAYYVVELSRLSRRYAAGSLVLVQCAGLAVAAALLSPLLETPRMVWQPGPVLAVAYLGLVATAFTWLLMTWGQARVQATEAGIIYTLEPVFAAIISITLGRDALSPALVIGGGLVVTAVLMGEAEPSREPAPPAGID